MTALCVIGHNGAHAHKLVEEVYADVMVGLPAPGTMDQTAGERDIIRRLATQMPVQVRMGLVEIRNVVDALGEILGKPATARRNKKLISFS